MANELAGKTLLLVDDDKDILAAMQSALGDLGAEIHTAGDGNTAITVAEQCKPDLILLDMMLPKRSGFLVLEKLKRGKAKTDPPLVVMITGNPGSRHKVYAESQGVIRYINKPFRMEALVEIVQKLLS
jgi:DNA-binding response OmpR family regulator